jgi:hypothetical protein
MNTTQIIPGSHEGECDDYDQALLHAKLAVKVTGQPHTIVLRNGCYYVTTNLLRAKRELFVSPGRVLAQVWASKITGALRVYPYAA